MWGPSEEEFCFLITFAVLVLLTIGAAIGFLVAWWLT